MKLELNSKLINSYKEHGKNPNYALSFMLNSMDPKTCVEGIELVDTFSIAGDVVEFQIDDKNARAIKSIFGTVNAVIVTKLLWTALLFPEI